MFHSPHKPATIQQNYNSALNKIKFEERQVNNNYKHEVVLKDLKNSRK